MTFYHKTKKVSTTSSRLTSFEKKNKQRPTITNLISSIETLIWYITYQSLLEGNTVYILNIKTVRISKIVYKVFIFMEFYRATHALLL